MSVDPSTSSAEAQFSPGDQTVGTVYGNIFLALTRNSIDPVLARISGGTEHVEVAVQYMPARPEHNQPECIKVMRTRLGGGSSGLHPRDSNHPEVLATIIPYDYDTDEQSMASPTGLPQIWIQFESTKHHVTKIAFENHYELCIGRDTRIRVYDLGSAERKRGQVTLVGRAHQTGEPVMGSSVEDWALGSVPSPTYRTDEM